MNQCSSDVADAADAERHDVERRVVVEWRRRAPLPIGSRVRAREEDFFAVVQRVDQRVAPLLERDGEGRRGGIGEAVLAGGEQRGIAHRPDETNGLRDAERLADPLQRVLGGVGDVGTADEPFEQPHAGRELLLLLVAQRGGFFDRDANARDAGVGRRTVTPARGPSRGVDRDECGRRRQA